MTKTDPDHLGDWGDEEALAEAMIPILGRLYRDHDVIVYIYGRKLQRSSIEIIKAHRFGRQVAGGEVRLQDTFPILEVISGMDLDSAKINLGKLTTGWLANDDDRALEQYLADELVSVTTGQGRLLDGPTDVVLFGFGRIGRLLARILIDRTGSGEKLRLRAIVLRPGQEDDTAKRASLLRRDSIHGPFSGSVLADPENQRIIANGNPIKLIYTRNPEDVDYTAYGINNAILIDNTGMSRDEEGLSRHLQAPGISRVLLTAPGKGDLKNIIYGVNHPGIDDEDRILSAASCTTNAMVPTLKLMNDTFGIVGGHLETVHAFTNDQNLTDNFHKKPRRGRAAPINMVITETGAAKAVAKALPELAGKLTGNAIRVPVPNVSLAILNLNLETPTTAAEINETLRAASLTTAYSEQIDFTASTELVSSDLVGTERAGVVDSQATICDDRRCVLYVWYDNEMGYSFQVVRIVQHLAGLNYPRVP